MRPWAKGPTIRSDLIGRRIRRARRHERQRVREERGKRAANVGGAENNGKISRRGLREAIPVDGERVALGRVKCQCWIQELDLRNRRNPWRRFKIDCARRRFIRLEYIERYHFGRIGCVPKHAWPDEGELVCMRRRGAPKRG